VVVAREQLALPALRLAPLLLGSLLVSEIGGERVAARLTEVEAYAGLDDPASHAFRGPTKRTQIMFGPAGFLYCYFSYGMHWCANVVCGPEGTAAAVLLRAGEIVEGEQFARRRRPAAKTARDLARGPARLAAALALGRDTDGADLCDRGSAVRIESLPARRARSIRTGPRVGISVATERPWRFWLADEPSVSTFKPGGRNRAAGTGQTGQP
jgi:DNA-3-methyladenine glycosylase